MLVKTGSNDSLLQASINHLDFDIYCLLHRPGSIIFTTYSVINIFVLLPLSILILYYGLQEWWKKHSTSLAVMTSHSDSFTYHVVIMELIGIFGCIISCCGVHREDLNILLVGNSLFTLTGYGQVSFHILTCVERYLAVVHPIIYLSLREERGIKIRNISSGCAWLLCFGGTSLVMAQVLIVEFCYLLLCFTITSFCSVSVLCVLIRPGPGEQGRNRKRVDQSKLRAFYTVVAILGVLLLRFGWSLFMGVVYVTNISVNCMIMACDDWLNLPSSLVLPLLFLHRAGKLRRS